MGEQSIIHGWHWHDLKAAKGMLMQTCKAGKLTTCTNAACRAAHNVSELVHLLLDLSKFLLCQ